MSMNSSGDDNDRLRLDKWLWHARFFKSRSTASRLCAGRKVRVNSDLKAKAHHPVRRGDVLTFPQGGYIRVVRVLALGTRRGPAPEAQALYDDLNPPRAEERAARAAARADWRRDGGRGRRRRTGL